MSKKNKKNRILCSEFNLNCLTYDEIAELFDYWEFQVLLDVEPYDTRTDFMLQNMLEYFVTIENYEYCCAVRDEIKKRELKSFIK